MSLKRVLSLDECGRVLNKAETETWNNFRIDLRVLIIPGRVLKSLEKSRANLEKS